MKLLRETIRKLILEGRGMFTHRDLPAEACIACYKDRGGRWWLQYCLFEDGKSGMALSEDGQFTDGVIVEDENGEPIHGYISFEPVETGKRGNCDGAYKVSSVKTQSGWGPLLYDCAIEFATMKAGGLIPDRLAVSDDARDVWDYYMDNRPDVKVKQLDNLQDSFQNGPEDDCDQDVAAQVAGISFNQPLKFDGDWEASALSKKYSKPPTTIGALGDRWEIVT